MHSADDNRDSLSRTGKRQRGNVSHLGGGAGEGDGGHRVNGDNASLACGQDDVLAVTHAEVLTQLGNELRQHRFDQPSSIAKVLALPTKPMGRISSAETQKYKMAERYCRMHRTNIEG